MPLSQSTANDIAAGIGALSSFGSAIPFGSLIIGLIQAGIKIEPTLEQDIKNLFGAGPSPTDADFTAAIASRNAAIAVAQAQLARLQGALPASTPPAGPPTVIAPTTPAPGTAPPPAELPPQPAVAP